MGGSGGAGMRLTEGACAGVCWCVCMLRTVASCEWYGCAWPGPTRAATEVGRATCSRAARLSPLLWRGAVPWRVVVVAASWRRGELGGSGE
jgi:hypothetical protein